MLARCRARRRRSTPRQSIRRRRAGTNIVEDVSNTSRSFCCCCCCCSCCCSVCKTYLVLTHQCEMTTHDSAQDGRSIGRDSCRRQAGVAAAARLDVDVDVDDARVRRALASIRVGALLSNFVVVVIVIVIVAKSIHQCPPDKTTTQTRDCPGTERLRRSCFEFGGRRRRRWRRRRRGDKDNNQRSKFEL